MGLALSAELIGRSATALEKVYGQGFVGGLLIGLMSTMPETAVVTFSAYYSNYQVAVGSSMGGNMMLFTLGVGIIGLAYLSRYRKELVISTEYSVERDYLLIATIALLLLIPYSKLDRVSGALLIVIYVAYLVSRIRSSRRGEGEKGTGLRRAGLEMLVGFLLGLSSSPFFSIAVNDLAQGIGVSPLILSLVIAPLATDMDTILTSLNLIRRDESGGSVSILGLIGSKIENVTILLGLIGAVSPSPVVVDPLNLVILVATNSAALFILWDRTLGRAESLALILFYVVLVLVTVIEG